MLFLVGYENDIVHAQRFADSLKAPGSANATVVNASQLCATLESIALSGGRIDAVVLLEDVYLWLPYTMAIRNLAERLTFQGVVRARAIPIVVAYMTGEAVLDASDSLLPAVESKVITDLPPWTTLVPSTPAQRRLPRVMDTIRQWRQELIAELDYVGFTVTESPTGGVEISHALRRKRRDSAILAPEGTPGALRKSQYLILAQDSLAGFEVLNEFKWQLENYQQIADAERIKPETVFQRFFEKHPHLVKRDTFDKVWPKPTLRRFEEPGKRYQPDFVLRPNVGAHIGTNWEVLDLKLPDVRLQTGKFHPSYSTSLVRAMQQLRNYRHYFSKQDKQTRQELLEKFGFQPSQPRIAVLIGRRDREEGLDQIQGTANDLDIDIITYDDIVEFEQNRLVLQSNIAGLFANLF